MTESVGGGNSPTGSLAILPVNSARGRNIFERGSDIFAALKSLSWGGFLRRREVNATPASIGARHRSIDTKPAAAAAAAAGSD